MKNTLIVIILTLFSVHVFGQEKAKINVVEGKTVKSAHNKTTYSNHDSKVGTDKKSSEEPVIILRLSSSDNVVADEKKTEVIPASNNENSDKPIVKEKPVKSIDQQIQDLDTYINAIDIKVEWVKNNPEEDKMAKETGWYEKMNENRKNSLNQKEKLLKSKK